MIDPGFQTRGDVNADFTARDGAEDRLKHALGVKLLANGYLVPTGDRGNEVDQNYS
jgi:hypothetical protein